MLNVEALKREVANLANKYKENDSVECIYFIPYTLNGEVTFELVVVFSNDATINETEIEKLNREYSEKVDEFGGKIILSSDRSDKYMLPALHTYEVRRVKDLISSTILFDKSGYYTKVAYQFDESNSMEKYENLFDVKITL